MYQQNSKIAPIHRRFGTRLRSKFAKRRYPHLAVGRDYLSASYEKMETLSERPALPISLTGKGAPRLSRAIRDLVEADH